MPDPLKLIGWRAITAYLTEHAPVPANLDTVMRGSRADDDPLPVKRWGPKRRPRVYALSAELDAWIERQGRERAG